MRNCHFLGLAAVPLAAAMPSFTHPYVREVASLVEDRATLVTASQFNFEPFNLTNIGMECARPATDDMFSCELRFDWHDPNSVRDNNVASCSCVYKWSWDGTTTEAGEKNTYDGGYTMCYKNLPTWFEMKIAAFNSTQDFSLEIAHHYKDSENFTAPYDYPTTIAEPYVHLPVIKREDSTIQLYEAGPVYAKIIGLTI